MLPKSYRFPLSTEFGRIKKEGQMINGSLFGLLIAKGYGTRFGFVISTKIDKRAVARHRVKRLLAEAVRANLKKIKPGYDFVFLAKKSVVGKSFEEVKKEVEIHLKKAELLNN